MSDLQVGGEPLYREPHNIAHYVVIVGVQNQSPQPTNSLHRMDSIEVVSFKHAAQCTKTTLIAPYVLALIAGYELITLICLSFYFITL